jgi:hypothetical protein
MRSLRLKFPDDKSKMIHSTMTQNRSSFHNSSVNRGNIAPIQKHLPWHYLGGVVGPLLETKGVKLGETLTTCCSAICSILAESHFYKLSQFYMKNITSKYSLCGRASPQERSYFSKAGVISGKTTAAYIIGYA